MDEDKYRVICDRMTAAGVKGKLYKTALRPAMMYGLETVAVTNWQESELTKMDEIKNEDIGGTAQVDALEKKLERQAEEGQWIFWKKDVKDGAAKQEEKRKTKKMTWM